MKGVRKNKLDWLNFLSNIMWILQEVEDQSLNRCFGSYGHKNRRFDAYSIECDFSNSRFPFFFQNLEI